jgi:hypothetical protein
MPTIPICDKSMLRHRQILVSVLMVDRIWADDRRERQGPEAQTVTASPQSRHYEVSMYLGTTCVNGVRQASKLPGNDEIMCSDWGQKSLQESHESCPHSHM